MTYTSFGQLTYPPPSPPTPHAQWQTDRRTDRDKQHYIWNYQWWNRQHTQTCFVCKIVHTHASKNMHTHTHTHTQHSRAHTHTVAHTHTHTHLHVLTHTYTHTVAHTLTHTHLRVRAHTHTHTHTHTHNTHTSLPPFQEKGCIVVTTSQYSYHLQTLHTWQ